ncbi:alpha/beta hydrolase family esterase [Aquibium microcysteis]|uniref:extracellular catalytic domain type 1 short-chain-length polyhydroxyalkanoate depolymerase n=1 Tax=Aquibium microcysteis TaxID=675281 RepID=UPI00165D1C00|nr:PHB depolymerase family esterase [Aquibium microcysteis]
MRKISDTIARLAALKTLHGRHSTTESAPDSLPRLTGFGTNPGALEARYRLPTGHRSGSPLVVVLHGCTQTAAGYDRHSGWSQLADEAGFALLYAEQQRANNPNLCFNWFLPGDTRRDAGETLSIRQMIDAMVARHGIDRDRIFVTGLSAGGAMAATMLATHPEIFSGGAIIAGLAHGMARTVPEAFDRMRGHGLPSEAGLQRLLREASDHRGPWPRITIWQGTADQTVAATNAQALAVQWRGVHGLDEEPAFSRTSGALARDVWSDPAGDAVLEINMIAGMGHGTPLAPGLGAPGPYMLDVGISSTRAIAGFFGIAEAQAAAESPRRFVGSQAVGAGEIARTTDAPPRHGADQTSSSSSPGTSGIQKTIEDALRAAGLMR